MNGPAPKPTHSLLVRSRHWHRWGGLFAGVFILVAATSGIVLNFKQPVFGMLGLETRVPRGSGRTDAPAKPPRVAFTTVTAGPAMGVNLDGALAAARAEWGEVSLERVELREEQGELTFKVRRRSGEEIWVNAASGKRFAKGEYEKITPAGWDGKPGRQLDWGRLLLNLHTGRIGGEAGKVVMSLAALTLLFLTGSGVYMWLKPLLLRRQTAGVKTPAAEQAGTGSPGRLAARELGEL
jgi:uncharacterized iron-regulated membrane protein